MVEYKKRGEERRGEGIKLIIEQEDMNDIIKIIAALEKFGIFLKGVSKTIENETIEQRGGFLSMLLGTLGPSLLGNLLSGSLLPFHPLTNIEISEYYKNEPRFNGVYSR